MLRLFDGTLQSGYTAYFLSNPHPPKSDIVCTRKGTPGLALWRSKDFTAPRPILADVSESAAFPPDQSLPPKGCIDRRYGNFEPVFNFGSQSSIGPPSHPLWLAVFDTGKPALMERPSLVKPALFAWIRKVKAFPASNAPAHIQNTAPPSTPWAKEPDPPPAVLGKRPIKGNELIHI